MKKLIEDPESFYTPKKRPSGHDISAGFGKDKSLHTNPGTTPTRCRAYHSMLKFFLNAFNFNRLEFNKKSYFLGFKKLTY
jgi:hypothetical protein